MRFHPPIEERTLFTQDTMTAIAHQGSCVLTSRKGENFEKLDEKNQKADALLSRLGPYDIPVFSWQQREEKGDLQKKAECKYSFLASCEFYRLISISG